MNRKISDYLFSGLIGKNFGPGQICGDIPEGWGTAKLKRVEDLYCGKSAMGGACLAKSPE